MHRSCWTLPVVFMLSFNVFGQSNTSSLVNSCRYVMSPAITPKYFGLSLATNANKFDGYFLVGKSPNSSWDVSQEIAKGEQGPILGDLSLALNYLGDNGLKLGYVKFVDFEKNPEPGLAREELMLLPSLANQYSIVDGFNSYLEKRGKNPSLINYKSFFKLPGALRSLEMYSNSYTLSYLNGGDFLFNSVFTSNFSFLLPKGFFEIVKKYVDTWLNLRPVLLHSLAKEQVELVDEVVLGTMESLIRNATSSILANEFNLRSLELNLRENFVGEGIARTIYSYIERFYSPSASAVLSPMYTTHKSMFDFLNLEKNDIIAREKIFELAVERIKLTTGKPPTSATLSEIRQDMDSFQIPKNTKITHRDLDEMFEEFKDRQFEFRGYLEQLPEDNISLPNRTIKQIHDSLSKSKVDSTN